MNLKIQAYGKGVAGKLKGVVKWKVPESTKKDVQRFISELELGRINRGRKVGESSRARYLDSLKVVLQFFAKPTAQITLKDVEEFEKALSQDKIRSHLKKVPYSHSTKVDLRKAFKVFMRWRLGQVKAIKLVGWLDTRYKEKTPDYLSEREVEKLFSGCRTTEQRFIIAVLFDSGARAEEFINIRYEDVHLPESKDNFVKITLKEEYSKTKGRTISLYWRHSLDAVREYLKERIAEGIKSTDPVFKATYGGMRMFLRRLGNEILKKEIHPHLFRHSSATHYATQLNRQELCYRYGWRFSSNMPDVYISRAGMENKNLDTKFTNTEIGTLKDELTKLQQAEKIKNETIQRLENRMNAMQSSYLETVYQIEQKTRGKVVTTAR